MASGYWEIHLGILRAASKTSEAFRDPKEVFGICKIVSDIKQPLPRQQKSLRTFGKRFENFEIPCKRPWGRNADDTFAATGLILLNFDSQFAHLRRIDHGQRA